MTRVVEVTVHGWCVLGSEDEIIECWPAAWDRPPPLAYKYGPDELGIDAVVELDMWDAIEEALRD